MAEKQPEVQQTVQQFQVAEEAKEVAAKEAAKAVEERTKATVSEQQHAGRMSRIPLLTGKYRQQLLQGQ